MKTIARKNIKPGKPLLFILTLFFSIAYSVTTFADNLASGVKVIDPYIRAIPPGQTISAMFLGLENTTEKDRALVKVHSDIAQNIELHEHVHKGGMMQMRQVPKVDVAAGTTTTLKPGGYHVMLINLNKAIAPMDKINLTLEYDDGVKQDIVAEVRKIGMGGGKKKSKHQSMKHMGNGMSKEVQHAMKHANPTPNLMQAILKFGDKLNLDEKQTATLKKWRDKRSPVVRKLALNIMKMEKDIYEASLAGEPEETIKAMTLNLMKARTKMIERKVKCRDNMKKVLSDEQFQKAVTLYRESHG